MNIEKFSKFLSDRGCEIIPVKSEHESLRFKGRHVGVLYKSGAVSGPYVTKAIHCWKNNKKWDGAPISTGRKSTYKKEKTALLERDGVNCFLCGEPLEDDITLEHLVPLTQGGKNNLYNMVLMHDECNQFVNNMSIAAKVKLAITKRLKLWMLKMES